MKITMAHGSGGNATKELIDQCFKEKFANKVLNKMEDAAVLTLTGPKIALTTDSFVVTPLSFPGGDIGKLAVCGTVNDLLMMGASPRYLTAGFILEEGLELATLEGIVSSMQRAAEEAKVTIVAGDTKVVQGKGGIYINTAGLGLIEHERDLGAAQVTAGDVIILSGSLGNHHACIMADRMGIQSNIQSDCAPLNEIVENLLAAGMDVKAMRDVTRGGLATVLNEIAEAAGAGINIDEEKLPVDPEVGSFCEILGLDPLYMANEGKLVCFVGAADAAKALAIIKQSRYGQGAKVIGQVIAGAKQVTVTTRLGGRRILDILYGEGLPRIC
ncbi:MAG: hydrogenase expression/formation protein HypE [Heliobacteriaceae bacterium]|nr:hydrogenase expression/formation protein HypE [Heliobacteriaceae bacterium]